MSGGIRISGEQMETKPGHTYYGYAFYCHDPKATHGHDMYGRCHIPATKEQIEGLIAGTNRILDNESEPAARTYERAECWCRLAIVRSGPRGGWEHVNTKKLNHPARKWTGKRRMAR